MTWLSNHFIQTAQDSPLAGVIPKAKIPEVLRLVATGKDAILHLHTDDDDIIEFTECELAVALRAGRTYLQKNAPHQYRDSVNSIFTSSSADSARHSVVSNQSRVSIASTDTHASIFDIETPAEPVAVPTSFPRTLGKPHICPTCGKECKHAWDLAKHIRDFHEGQLVVFCCWYCEQSSKDHQLTELHCHRAHPGHTPSVHVLTFTKVAYGCSFCESVLPSLEEYLKCMQDDQKKYPTLLPVPTKRLRALLRQSELTVFAIQRACTARRLHPHAWQQFVWNDDICNEYSRRLEYGCNGKNDIHRPGIDNIDQFIEALLEKASFESTGYPVPPRSHTDGAAHNIGPANDVPALNGTPLSLSTEPQYCDSFTEFPRSIIPTPNHRTPYYFTPNNMSSDDAANYRARTVSDIKRATERSNKRAGMNPDMLAGATAAAQAARQKRHPSQDSTSFSETGFHANKHPVTDKHASSEANIGGAAWAIRQAEVTASPYSNADSHEPTEPAVILRADMNATETPAPMSGEFLPINALDIDLGELGNEQIYGYQSVLRDENPPWNPESLTYQRPGLQYYEDSSQSYNTQPPDNNQQFYGNQQFCNGQHPSNNHNAHQGHGNYF